MLRCEKQMAIYLLVIEPQSICMVLASQCDGRKREKYAGKEIRQNSFNMEEAKISFCSGDS